MKTPCFPVSELLEKYFDQEVTDEERSLVEGHLKGCLSCQDVLKSLKTLRNLIKSPAEEALRKEQFGWVWQKIREEIRQKEKITFGESVQSVLHPSRFFQTKVWIPAAVATLILITVLLIYPAKSDLTITSVSGPFDGKACETIPITATVKNLGGRSEGFHVTFYLSKDRSITSDDIPIGSIYLNTLGAGAQRMFTAEKATIPCTLSPGPYYLGAIVDSDNRVVESDEKNNSLNGNRIDVSEALL
ncbi:MAG TPA: CARDB domain-containing protein [Thermodesulfobacteriota bacterium]|nr:CARDB domain-containing protein [Thermodesulfobacteriota bacterium]